MSSCTLSLTLWLLREQYPTKQQLGRSYLIIVTISYNYYNRIIYNIILYNTMVENLYNNSANILGLLTIIIIIINNHYYWASGSEPT